MEKQIEELREEFNKRLDDILAKGSAEFEVGKWYKSQSFGNLVNFQGDIERGNFGFGYVTHSWVSSLGFPHNDTGFIPATPSEIESALIKEAEKKYPLGSTIKTLDGNKITLDGYAIEYDEIKDRLVASCRCHCPEDGRDELYKQGQWAEIVKEEEVKIAGEVVEISNGNRLFIANVAYSKSDVESCARILSLPKVSGIEVTKCNGQKVILTSKDIQKVLDSWK